MKANINQPGLFNDISLYKPQIGKDMGLQANMDGSVTLQTTEPTEAVSEAADIIKRGTMYKNQNWKYKPWRK